MFTCVESVFEKYSLSLGDKGVFLFVFARDSKAKEKKKKNNVFTNKLHTFVRGCSIFLSSCQRKERLWNKNKIHIHFKRIVFISVKRSNIMRALFGYLKMFFNSFFFSGFRDRVLSQSAQCRVMACIRQFQHHFAFYGLENNVHRVNDCWLNNNTKIFDSLLFPTLLKIWTIFFPASNVFLFR